ncbi:MULTISPECIES: Holliday junction branch migration protein RuvA [Croceibacter]|jgi:Holliday junction DNA helicase RuvA|uniref:Holliday junction branch migration protein RuvA n=1 Tax=Croceibacter TaxID=216431 RepID=UPI000C37CAE9|nr:MULTISPECIES: Holliday junction branch migration protein RuvA [Croceibacter]HAT69055.1 Holliday junction branch migration protein RuvA [Flavobacteriaceae bacterium]MAM22385.1 Holliday junction branch migration protein RuvA [Croceibacter sp.]MBG24503.1 Holliday junction branch migration protein RuvA [Croceibacter sp.]MBW4970433.1 Holliday junction branch migration protein RuvA [Croceibacter atlanticus]WSP34940.1 Holliday junction branch migration protein RuvA [Croceibacter atlanticus]|tara:strand:+ start:194 stop:775 length:582 start_codon:yes stop_codon:yes gene_type:complete
MITQLAGQLIEKNPTNIIVDCGGVGYFVNISLHTFGLIKNEERVKIFTHLQVREDAHTLFGFAEKAEREVFRLLIGVSGIGASTARTMLSSLTPQQVTEAISQGDVATIQSVKGIGLKTAQRVIIDLKDKILNVVGLDEVLPSQGNTQKEEALSALETLGYTRKQSDKVVAGILKTDPEASVETIIKLALKKL